MKFSIIDTHCDTATEMCKRGVGLYNNQLHLDFAKFDGAKRTQFFAVFNDPEHWDNAKEYAFGIIRKLKSEIEKSKGKIVLCQSYEDYRNAAGKMRCFLSMEGGKPIESAADLDEFYRAGVRMLSLVWNKTNQLAAGAGETDSRKGLTVLGREIVLEANRLGIIIDLSHASDKTFWDIAEISKKPLFASHSNSRAITPHKRNLTDEQVRAIIKTGGYIGLNFYPPFLSTRKTAAIDDILRHTEHFLELGAADNLGIGADFDGVDFLPAGINGAEDTEKVFDAMLRRGYSEELVRKISYTNMERILQENL